MNMQGDFKKVIVVSHGHRVVVNATNDGKLTVETIGDMSLHAKKGDEITLILEE